MTDFIIKLLKTKNEFDIIIIMICKFSKKLNSFLIKKLELLLNKLRLILLLQLIEVFFQYKSAIKISNDFQNSEHSCLMI